MRSLLCIPYGGLNDTLVQIEKCYSYAKEFNRDLYIDTRHSGIFLNFNRFFHFRNQSNCQIKINEFTTDDDLDCLNHIVDVLPAAFSGQLGRIGLRHVIRPGYQGYTIEHSGEPTTFDFECDHTNQLLVHLNCGGGIESHRLLGQLRLSANAAADVKMHLQNLPEHFLAIHIRGTDLTTEYLPFIETHANQLRESTLLVCSDNLEIVQEFIRLLPNTEVLFNKGLARQARGNGERLHDRNLYSSDAELYEATILSLQDLFALALSDHLFILKHRGGWYSGFSRLAYFLHQNQSSIAEMLSLGPPSP